MVGGLLTLLLALVSVVAIDVPDALDLGGRDGVLLVAQKVTSADQSWVDWNLPSATAWDATTHVDTSEDTAAALIASQQVTDAGFLALRWTGIVVADPSQAQQRFEVNAPAGTQCSWNLIISDAYKLADSSNTNVLLIESSARMHEFEFRLICTGASFRQSVRLAGPTCGDYLCFHHGTTNPESPVADVIACGAATLKEVCHRVTHVATQSQSPAVRLHAWLTHFRLLWQRVPFNNYDTSAPSSITPISELLPLQAQTTVDLDSAIDDFNLLPFGNDTSVYPLCASISTEAASIVPSGQLWQDELRSSGSEGVRVCYHHPARVPQPQNVSHNPHILQLGTEAVGVLESNLTVHVDWTQSLTTGALGSIELIVDVTDQDARVLRLDMAFSLLSLSTSSVLLTDTLACQYDDDTDLPLSVPCLSVVNQSDASMSFRVFHVTGGTVAGSANVSVRVCLDATCSPASDPQPHVLEDVLSLRDVTAQEVPVASVHPLRLVWQWTRPPSTQLSGSVLLTALLTASNNETAVFANHSVTQSGSDGSVQTFEIDAPHVGCFKLLLTPATAGWSTARSVACTRYLNVSLVSCSNCDIVSPTKISLRDTAENTTSLTLAASSQTPLFSDTTAWSTSFAPRVLFAFDAVQNAPDTLGTCTVDPSSLAQSGDHQTFDCHVPSGTGENIALHVSVGNDKTEVLRASWPPIELIEGSLRLASTPFGVNKTENVTKTNNDPFALKVQANYVPDDVALFLTAFLVPVGLPVDDTSVVTCTMATVAPGEFTCITARADGTSGATELVVVAAGFADDRGMARTSAARGDAVILPSTPILYSLDYVGTESGNCVRETFANPDLDNADATRLIDCDFNLARVEFTVTGRYLISFNTSVKLPSDSSARLEQVSPSYEDFLLDTTQVQTAKLTSYSSTDNVGELRALRPYTEITDGVITGKDALLIGFAAPQLTNITNVKSCSGVNHLVCPRTAGSQIEIKGRNLPTSGDDSARVLIGSLTAAFSPQVTQLPTKIQLVLPLGEGGTSLAFFVSQPRGGRFSEPSTADFSISYSPCPAGQGDPRHVSDLLGGIEADLEASGCAKCPSGYYSHADSDVCAPCPRGSYAASNGNQACTKASQGFFVSSLGAVTQQQCPPLSISSVTGASECLSCPPHHIASEDRTSCERCAIEEYVNPGLQQCVPCPLGKIASGDGLSCTLCIPGHRWLPRGHDNSVTGDPTAEPINDGDDGEDGENDAAGVESSNGVTTDDDDRVEQQFECVPCPAGSYLRENAPLEEAQCQACAPGTVQPNIGQSTCVPCVPGRFQSTYGQTECVACPAWTYQPRVGQLECRPCAGPNSLLHGTDRDNSTGNGTDTDNLSDDLLDGHELLPGWYPATEQSACDACPARQYQKVPLNESLPREGGCFACDAERLDCGESVPGVTVGRSGTWFWQEADTGEVHTHKCRPGRCLYPLDAEAQENSQECMEVAAEINAYAKDTSLVSTVGLVRGCCGANRQPFSENPLCGQCLPDYYEWGGSCVSCQSTQNSLLALVFFMSWLATIVFHTLSQSTRSEPKIFTYFIQMALLFFGSASGDSGAWLQFMTWINVDVSSVSGGSVCVARFDAVDQLLLSVLAPLVLLLQLWLTALLVVVVAFLRGWRPHGNVPTMAGEFADDGVVDYTSLNKHTWRGQLQPFVRTTMAIAIICFNNITDTVFGYWRCIEVRPGVSVVQRYPALRCDDSSYTQLAPVMWIAFLLVTVLLPLALTVFLYRRYQQGRVFTIRFLSHYGIFVENYRCEVFYYESVVFMRRLLLVALAVGYMDDRRTLMTALSIANLVVLLLHILLMPYWRFFDNIMEGVTLFILTVVTVSLSGTELPLSAALNAVFGVLILLPAALIALYMAGRIVVRRVFPSQYIRWSTRLSLGKGRNRESPLERAEAALHTKRTDMAQMPLDDTTMSDDDSTQDDGPGAIGAAGQRGSKRTREARVLSHERLRHSVQAEGSDSEDEDVMSPIEMTPLPSQPHDANTATVLPQDVPTRVRANTEAMAPAPPELSPGLRCQPSPSPPHLPLVP
ncbi:MAG: hypothetical protein MHM6MM_004466 [Cercozoa sp. M6MM]